MKQDETCVGKRKILPDLIVTQERLNENMSKSEINGNEKEEISNNLADLVGMKHYEVFVSAIPHIRFFFFPESYHDGNRHISLSIVCF